jgi:organic radical activating enzyme
MNNSDTTPKKIQQLGQNLYAINFNIQQVEREERTSYDYETVVVSSKERVELVKALIAHKYTIEDEIKLLYRGQQEQIKEHEEYVAWCKEYVDALVELGVKIEG